MDLAARSAAEVFEDHLELARRGDLDGDLERNVAEDIVILTGRGRFEGHEGVRELARQLMAEIPNGEWRYTTRHVDDRVAFLEWTVETGPYRVPDGADSFLIEDGKIRAQTIHYTVTDPAGTVVIRADGTHPDGIDGLHPSERALIESVLDTRTVPEPYATALRAVDCADVVDDMRLCLALQWIAVDDITTSEALNESMGSTIGIASGVIYDLVGVLHAGGYLTAATGSKRDFRFALTAKGRLAADILRAAHRDA